MSFLFFNRGTWRVTLIIILLDRRVNLLEKTKPSFIDYIKNMHVIQLFSNFINTSIDYHVVILIKLWSVSTSCYWFIYKINFSPFSQPEVKYPCITQFLVIVIFSTKNYHALILIFITNYCWMTSSRTWRLLTFIFYFFPCIWFKVVFENIISSLSKCKSSKNKHTFIKNQSCVLIPGFREIFIFSIQCFWFQKCPLIFMQVKWK